ncbi:hypothetical protein SNOG_03024 [Parastagonospora nodorum SN15]|uniref:SH3 domain-containing protein n=1 Tax=Phaeosphaeria nodorum (strain SN15 / ATCC MYA-4574 / FGSC 10173) TaxID=321614 RepID=Q0UYZ0_PHANO|nr:hypothetical protein SNOG_03024 [Parastagonospora nodorum SN15]EAT89755.2 hypothetical protein SNOG_03024 [Parastagonospora nodorum SN15]
MAHHHNHAHLVRRQRDDDDDNGNAVVVTTVKVVTAPNTYTVPVTFVGPDDDNGPARITLGPPAQRPLPPSTTSATSKGDTKGYEPSQSTLMVATKPPTPSLANAAGTLAASASATISAAASAGSSEGMSGGAKAGLALGILVGVGALLVGILLVYRRKKNQMAPTKDDEKISMHNAPAPPPPQVQFTAAPAAPSVRTERTMSTAPRLSLRPVTQFDPAFENGNKSGNNMLGVAAAAPLTPSKERDLPDRPRSAWERPGAAANVPAAENPFSDPHSGPPSANPFGNNAAVDASQSRIPDSPPNASPLHSTSPSTDFANPAPVIAAATAMSSAPPAQSLPAPPSINAASEGVPPSPAWTEDLPASPGPAPTGALPVAGAHSNGPAPAPNNVHRVQLDFKPSMQDELGLNAGQLVRMLHEYDDGWALCIRMDRSQQGVVPRTCLSKHPVKPRGGPPRQAPPPGMRGPPLRSPMGPGGVPQPRPLSPGSGPNSPHPSANGRMSPSPHAMSPGPRQMSPQMQGPPRGRSNSNAPQQGPPRGRSNSNAPYAAPQRSMSPGPYGGGPQMAPPPQMGRPRSNSANQAGNMRRGPAPALSPMNPNAGPINPGAGPMPSRKPVPGMAL